MNTLDNLEKHRIKQNKYLIVYCVIWLVFCDSKFWLVRLVIKEARNFSPYLTPYYEENIIYTIFPQNFSPYLTPYKVLKLKRDERGQRQYEF
jgi:hypothetical protein